MRLNLLILSLTCVGISSCVQDPETAIQAERITDLKEKDLYLNQKIEDANQKINELEKKVNELSSELDQFKKKPVRRTISKRPQDSINVNLKIRN